MKKTIALIVAAIALLASNTASMGCLWILSDEPVAPKSFKD